MAAAGSFAVSPGPMHQIWAGDDAWLPRGRRAVDVLRGPGVAVRGARGWRRSGGRPCGGDRRLGVIGDRRPAPAEGLGDRGSGLLAYGGSFTGSGIPRPIWQNLRSFPFFFFCPVVHV
jgi:hypothetical protein